MSDPSPFDNNVTKEWCSHVRESCSVHMDDKYNMMKELFTSRLDGIEDQLESMFKDIQGVLSTGSTRMNEIESSVGETKTAITREIEGLKNDFHALELSTAVAGKFSVPQIVSMIAAFFLIASVVIGTWGRVNVNREKIRALHQKTTELEKMAQVENRDTSRIDTILEILNRKIKK